MDLSNSRKVSEVRDGDLYMPGEIFRIESYEIYFRPEKPAEVFVYSGVVLPNCTKQLQDYISRNTILKSASGLRQLADFICHFFSYTVPTWPPLGGARTGTFGNGTVSAGTAIAVCKVSPQDLTASYICPCGITRSDCDYHR